MSAAHLRLLALFADVNRVADAHRRIFGARASAIMAEVIEAELPELRGQRQLYAQLLKDLYHRGLLDETVEVAYGGMRGAEVLYPPDAFRKERLTAFGKQFLAFIRQPRGVADLESSP